jgi:hypothetical protein
VSLKITLKLFEQPFHTETINPLKKKDLSLKSNMRISSHLLTDKNKALQTRFAGL